MGLLQPLYYPGGRYTPGADRKLLASIIGSEADGTRSEGVIASKIDPVALSGNSMAVTAGTGLQVRVQAGLCVIADAATQNFNSPGMYLAGIDATEYLLSISGPGSGTRTDLIYASFDDTPVTIINKARSGSTCTLTTSAPHGFVAGQTVVVSGVDEVLDGVFTIGTTPLTTTFTYTKGSVPTPISTAVKPNVIFGDDTYVVTNKEITVTGAVGPSNVVKLTVSADPTSVISIDDMITVKGVGSTFDGNHIVTGVTSSPNVITYYKVAEAVTSVAISNSATAVARVPFAIKQATGTTTLPAGTNIALAEITVSTTAVNTVVDRRKFVAASGAVHLYDSTAGGSANALRPAGTKGQLAFDISANIFYYYNGTAWTAVSSLALGSTSTTAAAGDHVHNSSAISTANVTLSNTAISPFAAGTLTVLPSRTYLFNGVFLVQRSSTGAGQTLNMQFDFNVAPTSGNFYYEFTTKDYTSTTLLNQFDIVTVNTTTAVTTSTSGSGNNDFHIIFSGVMRTTATTTTVTPKISVTGGGASGTAYKNCWIEFTDVGSSSVTAISGTWS
jgi:hypothetical protein